MLLHPHKRLYTAIKLSPNQQFFVAFEQVCKASAQISEAGVNEHILFGLVSVTDLMLHGHSNLHTLQPAH